MTQGQRVALSTAQRTELWSRWKAGQSLRVIGRALPSAIFGGSKKVCRSTETRTARPDDSFPIVETIPYRTVL